MVQQERRNTVRNSLHLHAHDLHTKRKKKRRRKDDDG